MTDETRTAPTDRETAKEAGALVLALGGIAAAFGVASCCALPVLLGSLSLGSAWLAGVAIIAAPHRAILLTAAVACLVGAGATLAWRRRALVCVPGAACGHPAVTPLIIGCLALGTALAIVGYLFA